MNDLEKKIQHAINSESAENASNTPDYILAQYLMTCLAAFNTATQQRKTWYGRDARPSLPESPAKEQPGEQNDVREFLEYWTAGHLQTFEDRERFRKAATALIERLGQGWIPDDALSFCEDCGMYVVSKPPPPERP